MGRQVRRVPKDWQHPKNELGHYIPLHDGFNKDLREWDEGAAKWAEGLMRDYDSAFDGSGWEPKGDCNYSYEEWAGKRPVQSEYMPDWPAEQRTHLMMYEDTSEGTPISPAFETPEELARWLTDNRASAFGSMKASYESWLATARGGWAPSAVMDAKGFRSGVEAMGDKDR